jgi:hypothetical protein
MEDVSAAKAMDRPTKLQCCRHVAGAGRALHIEARGPVAEVAAARDPSVECGVGSAAGVDEQYAEAARRQSFGEVEHVARDAATRRLRRKDNPHLVAAHVTPARLRHGCGATGHP